MHHGKLALALPQDTVSTINFVETILLEAIRLKASDIHVECYENSARLRYRLDGILRTVAAGDFLFSQYQSVATRIKVLASLDIADRRLPQDGGFIFSHRHGQVNIRVSVLPAEYAERFVLRILGNITGKVDLDRVGMNRVQVNAVKRALGVGQGMVLVTGPTGSGKTTTLYTMLAELNQENINILTAENPIERSIEGVGQVQINMEAGLDFSHALRAFLRQDPEVILIGEIRDFETADIATKAALTGHLVLSTLHTNDAATTLMRLVGIGLATSLISVALSLIVSQRLVRLICQNCKIEDRTATGVWPKSGRDIPLFIGQGCDQCAYTGCKDRVGIFEVLGMNPKVCAAISDGLSRNSLEKFIIGGNSLQQSGKTLLKEGKISLAEYHRVLS